MFIYPNSGSTRQETPHKYNAPSNAIMFSQPISNCFDHFFSIRNSEEEKTFVYPLITNDCSINP